MDPEKRLPRIYDRQQKHPSRLSPWAGTLSPAKIVPYGQVELCNINGKLCEARRIETQACPVATAVPSLDLAACSSSNSDSVDCSTSTVSACSINACKSPLTLRKLV